jgi:hypothetical protein
MRKPETSIFAARCARAKRIGDLVSAGGAHSSGAPAREQGIGSKAVTT